jgi:hypothetical protein
MADYKTVVQLSSAWQKQCPICKKIPLMTEDPDIGAQINHYLEHGYTLIHVGQETTKNNNGELWQTSVAVLGK